MKSEATPPKSPASVLGAAVISGAIMIGFMLGFSVFCLVRNFSGANSESGLALPQESPVVSVALLSSLPTGDEELIDFQEQQGESRLRCRTRVDAKSE